MAERAESGAFVGRMAELGVLRGLVAGVAEGRGGVAWVEGEPGIGKSALVAEALSGAAGLGCAVFLAPADPLRGRFPLGVMLDCLGVEGGPDEGERGKIVGLLRGEGMGGVVPAGDAVAAAAERVLALVDGLCAVCPVVLVIDDLQWADEASVSVWHRLAGGADQVPLLVMGTSRPVPRPAGLAVARRAVAERGGLVMSLRPLPAAEVTALVGGLVGSRPGPGLLAQAERAGGNPLYLRELTDALLREDRVRVSGGLAEVTDGAARAGSSGPVSLAAAIEDRLGFLSGRTLDVLRVAALLGGRFSVRDLRIVQGSGAWELAEVVGEALAAGVLVEWGQDLAFRHGLIQQALAEGMPAGLRAELHRDAARVLADAGVAAERVAAQLLAAGGDLDDWMVDWLAGHAAALVHRAPRGAAELLERAVSGAAAGDERGQVLEEHLAGVLFLLGRFEQAEAAARGLLARTRDPERRARIAWTLAHTLLRTTRPAEALAVTGQALTEAPRPDVWRARLRSLHALALAGAGRFTEADAAAAEALADAERAGDRFAAGYALHVWTLTRFSGGDDAGGLEIVERALTVIGDDPETTDLRLLLLTNRLGTLELLDREAGAQARQLLALAEQTSTARIGTVRWSVAEYLFGTGRWDDAMAELEVLFQPGADVEADVLTGARGSAALIAAHRDDRAGAAAHLAAASLLPDPAGHHRVYGWYLLRAKATLAEREGRPGEAASLLQAALADGGSMGEMLPWLPDLVRCALASGDLGAAGTVAARCEAEVARHGGPGLAVAAARRCRGLVEGDAGPLEEAVAYYRSVTRPLGLGQALEDLAVVRAAGGDLAGARAALGEAAGVYAELGAEWDALRADARLRPYGVRRRRAGARRPASGWAALTPTEGKVAYLVGEGLSNPEIGARLFLSRYTVQVHVSRILAKLGVRSRVEVAGQVARHAPEPGGPEAAARSTA